MNIFSWFLYWSKNMNELFRMNEEKEYPHYVQKKHWMLILFKLLYVFCDLFARARCYLKSFLAVFNRLEFRVSLRLAQSLYQVKEPSLSYNLSITERGNIWKHTFPKVIRAMLKTNSLILVLNFVCQVRWMRR